MEAPPLNVCNSVHVFALPRFKLAVIVPDVVIGELPIVREPELETPTDVTVPLPPAPIQAPLMAKHPPVKVKPLAKVEVAEIEVIFRALACTPPAKVDVDTLVDIKFVTVVVPEVRVLATFRLVEVAFKAVKFWRVVEPATVKSPTELIVVVAVPPTEKLLKEYKLLDESAVVEA